MSKSTTNTKLKLTGMIVKPDLARVGEVAAKQASKWHGVMVKQIVHAVDAIAAGEVTMRPDGNVEVIGSQGQVYVVSLLKKGSNAGKRMCACPDMSFGGWRAKKAADAGELSQSDADKHHCWHMVASRILIASLED